MATPDGMGIDAVMWPDVRWAESRAEWLLAEEMGIGRGWVYDHLNLAPQHDRWHDAYTYLAAVAATTSRIGLGTMVTTPNFRHPTTSAKAALTLDDVSGGRLLLGVGAGGPGADSDAQGSPALSRPARMDRFAEWVEQLDRLLDGEELDHDGTYATVRSTRVRGSTGHRPSLAVAATGPRGMQVAARRASHWITQDVAQDPRAYAGTAQGEIARQLVLLDAACRSVQRDPASLPRTAVLGYGTERPLESAGALEDALGRYAALGITTVAVLWPRGEGASRRLDVLGAALA